MTKSSIETEEAAEGETSSKEFVADLIRRRSELRRHATKLARSAADADDMVQDTLERALRAERTFRVGTQMHAWLMVIMRNVFLDGRRRQSRFRNLTPYELEVLPARETREVGLPDLLSVEDIDAAVDGLKPIDRDIFRMIHRERLPYRTVAERLNISLSTTGVRVWRARQRVRHALEAKWNSGGKSGGESGTMSGHAIAA